MLLIDKFPFFSPLKCWPILCTTEVSFSVGSLRFKMSSSHWIKTQIFTKLMKSDGHLSMLTFWFSWCSCQMELTTSFQSKSAKFETFLHFFQSGQQLMQQLWEKGRKEGKRTNCAVGQWECDNSSLGLHFWSSPAFCSLMKDLWPRFKKGHGNIFMTSHFYLFISIIKLFWLPRYGWPDWKTNDPTEKETSVVLF